MWMMRVIVVLTFQQMFDIADEGDCSYVGRSYVLVYIRLDSSLSLSLSWMASSMPPLFGNF